MTALKTFQAAVGASLAIHFVGVLSVGIPLSQNETINPPDAFELTEPKLLTEPAPLPQAPPRPETSASLPARLPSKTAPGAAPKAGRGASGEPTFKSEKDFISDPAAQRVFIKYFAGIKQRIHNTLQKRYFREHATTGSVGLFFIVGSSGRLQHFSISPKSARADMALKQLAVECLRDAAPFAPFPAALDAERIAFNVTLNFDEF